MRKIDRLKKDCKDRAELELGHTMTRFTSENRPRLWTSECKQCGDLLEVIAPDLSIPDGYTSGLALINECPCS